jgi:hypothetical protein
MKWRTHQLVTLATAFLVTKSAVNVCFAFLGSTFPDVIERNSGQEITFKNHRQLSHWFVIYTGFGLAVWIFSHYLEPHQSELSTLIEALYYFIYGCINHLLLDALNGTIPGINPKNHKKRWGKNIIKKDLFEFVFLLSFVLLSCIIYKLKG